MTMSFARNAGDALPIYLVSADELENALEQLGSLARSWSTAQNFIGKAGQVLVIPDENGGLAGALVGYGRASDRIRGRFWLASARAQLPDGVYKLRTSLSGHALEQEYLGWLFAGYSFDRYKSASTKDVTLLPPEDGALTARLEAIAAGEKLTRDLINTPAADMGPEDLEEAARALAADHQAKIDVTIGDELLGENLPLIHTVGRASARAPRLIDMRWRDEGPLVTLVGKGVCFDTGGLNLKPGGSMALMKKDMGGAATVLGLAHMIMALGLPIRLRVLIPAVENSVGGNAFRPGDILTSRKGLSIEINNTDAEGRLVLADALALAEEETPDLIVSMATLTGAARVALGPDLAPYYTDNNDHAAALEAAAIQVADPVWRMPFHDPYETIIEPGIADLDNAPKGGAGSITAALFLRRFVTETPYMHFDIYGWQPTSAPGRTKGGVGQGARALLDALPKML